MIFILSFSRNVLSFPRKTMTSVSKTMTGLDFCFLTYSVFIHNYYESFPPGNIKTFFLDYSVFCLIRMPVVQSWSAPGQIEDLFYSLRGAREGSISSDAMHGRVVMAVCCRAAQCSKYLFVLNQDMSVMVADSDTGLYPSTQWTSVTETRWVAAPFSKQSFISWKGNQTWVS